MTAFVAVATPGRPDPPELPVRCVGALRLAGAGLTSQFFTGGFACAAVSSGASGASGSALRVEPDVIAVGDVRLDARDELRRTLRGARPNGTDADSRAPDDDLGLVVAARRAWDEGVAARLRGDFSLALWDPRHRALLAARDGLGVRPLYYACIPGGVVVSNVLDAVRAHPSVSSQLDEAAVVSFLRLGWNADTTTTTFGAVRRLAPGGGFAFGVADSTPRLITHWNLPDPEPLELRDDAEYVERYRALLTAAVADRLEPRGTVLLLSGGIDSPTIAAATTAVAPSGARLSAVTTRYLGIESPDEVRLATAVAARLGLAHTVFESGAEPQFAGRRQTPEPYDDPEFPASCEFVASLGKSGGVVFDGEDGDALFSPPGLATQLRRYPARRVARDVARYTFRFGHHPYLGFWLKRRLRFWKRRASAREPAWLTARGRALLPTDAPAPLRHRSHPEGVRSLTSPMWQSLHAGCDRAYHGAAVEFRWPLLDARLLEFVFAIPPIPWCQRKYLARRAYEAELPAEVIERRKTTIPGYHDAIVADWRVATGAACPALHPRTAELVDRDSLATVLREGGTEDVLVAWRVIQFDGWVRGAGLS